MVGRKANKQTAEKEEMKAVARVSALIAQLMAKDEEADQICC